LSKLDRTVPRMHVVHAVSSRTGLFERPEGDRNNAISSLADARPVCRDTIQPETKRRLLDGALQCQAPQRGAVDVQQGGAEVR
jgi:hypothetical protein